MILVPLFDLKFLFELEAGDAGTSNRRHGGGGDGSKKAGFTPENRLFCHVLLLDLGTTGVSAL
jgi:hypothetical protein